MNPIVFQNSGNELNGLFLFHSDFFNTSDLNNIQNKMQQLGTQFIISFLTSGLHYTLISTDLDIEKLDLPKGFVISFIPNSKLNKNSVIAHLDPNTHYEPIKNILEICFFKLNGISTEIKKTDCTHFKNTVCIKIELSMQTLEPALSDKSPETKIQNSVRMFCFNLKGFLNSI